MKVLRQGIKRTAQGIALLLALPAALLALFGRFQPAYSFFAQAFAVGPGLPGSYLRAAYYKLTLRRCSIDITISFGTYFVQPDSSVGELASLGSYCVVGRAAIGPRTQIGSHVLVPSGKRQHLRNPDGTLSDCLDGQTVIGADCWIGDAAVIMAELGDGVTVGAGAVVTHAVAPHTVVAGNPARPIQQKVTAGQLG
ncbi:MAG TPA: DapH/DapD/GlmU-related protein [Terriglobales bacterium]|nr:DapH/DapD/GlmU-related protein [Terriglobales bacterium]